MLAAKHGVLWSDSVDDDVDGQHYEHEDHAHEEQALGASTPRTNLVHLKIENSFFSHNWKYNLGQIINGYLLMLHTFSHIIMPFSISMKSSKLSNLPLITF